MPWQETFAATIGPGAFSGITSGLWFQVLRENHFDVDRRYWCRAGFITAGSVMNTALAWWENLRYARRITLTEPDPPLFVLGLWRSGTTHLHNLLARDDRFAYPAFYDVLCPHTFLSTARTNAKLMDTFLPKIRPMDNMRMGRQEPQEDEFALCSLIGRTYQMILAFPRRTEHYERFLTLHDVTDDERTEWQSALKWIVKKLAFKYRQPLVLKSPGHTCRIRLLLDLFPDAKFVYIRRNPFDVFRSAKHAVLKLSPYWTLQHTDYENLDDQIIREYKMIIDVYLEEREMIPKGHLQEVSFETLEADPLGEVRRIYDSLALPAFRHAEPTLRSYVDSLSGYKKNTFEDLPDDLRERLGYEWQRSFEEWGYCE